MHPFLRLAKSYQQLFKTDSNSDKEALESKTKIAQYIQKINKKQDFPGKNKTCWTNAVRHIKYKRSAINV